MPKGYSKYRRIEIAIAESILQNASENKKGQVSPPFFTTSLLAGA